MMETPSGWGGGTDERRALDAILRRAATDRAFRLALLRDPRAAIAEAYGVTIPPDFRVRFVERGRDLDALIVLPDLEAPVEGGDELLVDATGGTCTSDRWYLRIVGD